MNFGDAVIKEQGVTFATAVAKSYALYSSSREENRKLFTPYFPNTLLSSQNSRDILTYHGRTDIDNFLANVHPSQIPWRRYTV